MPELSEHARRNREQWGSVASTMVAAAQRNWSTAEPSWGIWKIPDSDVGLLGDLNQYRGLDVVELGCGTAYVSAWLARAGARPVGIDITPEQLDTARRLQTEHGIEFPLIEASAEHVPLPDASFDLAISEYGASIWCDPYQWIPEAARLIRPGGRLIFLANSVLVMLCTAPDALEDEAAGITLARDQFGMHRFEWVDDPSVEFHVPHSVMIDILHGSGFQVERLIELQAPAGATSRHHYVTPEWAQRWPCEEVWIARRTS